MEQLSYLQTVESKGYGLTSEMYSVYSDIMFLFTNYEYAYNYIRGSAKEDIDAGGNENGMHLIIEPIILPSIANAIFIAMYGDLESSINNICKAHSNEKNYHIKLKDIVGNGIQRAVTFLDKVIQIKVNDNKEWNELKHWNRVRNILVHNNGVIRGREDEESIKVLKLGTNPKYNKVYLTIDECDRFHLLILKFTLLCISATWNNKTLQATNINSVI